MDRKEYQRKFYDEHYERIHLAVPKGMKDVIQGLAREKGMSVNAYIQDLVRKDQEGMFDLMQVSDKNRAFIAGIQGNMHDGYDIIFRDGHKGHCRTKKDAREYIVKYCAKQAKSCTRQENGC